MKGLGDDNDGYKSMVEASLYKSMFEAILDCAIFMQAVDGQILNWNSGAVQIYGYRSDEIIGQHFSLLYPREDARSGKPERELAIAIEKGRFVDQGWRLRKDGTRFWADVVVTGMWSGTGELQAFVRLSRDLTEQKRVEDELRRSRERFQGAIESAPNSMMLVNRAGRIEMLNLQVERTFGYSRDELLGKPVEMLIPERFRRQHLKDRLFFYADPKTRPMGRGRDLNALTKDGAEFPVEIGLNLIETEEGTMVLASIVDITERKLKEEELLRSEARFRCAVESAPAAMVMANRRGGIEMVNRETERLFGYPRDELLGQPIEILIPERFHGGEFRALFSTDFQPRRMVAGRELYARRRDGREVPVEICFNPIETEEGLMVLVVMVDITDRKQKEHQA